MEPAEKSHELAPLDMERSKTGTVIDVEPVKCNPLLIVPFVLYLIWVQAISAITFAFLLVGIAINPGTVCGHLCRILCTKYRTTVNSAEVLDDTQQPVFFLSNHRSWGDFWTDGALLGGPSFVARWLVMVGIPFTGLWGWTQGWIWFFNRGRNRSAEGGTIKWMEGFYLNSHKTWSGKGLVVYPEGTRSTLPWGNSLKHGGLVVAHTIGWPVQIVITTNKERLLLEGKGHIGFGVTCTTAVSEPIYPRNFAKINDFIPQVEKVWRETWKAAYTEQSTERAICQLKGVVQKPGAGPCPGSIALNVVRLVVAVALGAGIYSYTQ